MGDASSPQGSAEIVRWTSAGSGAEALGCLPGLDDFAFPYGVSADGSVIVGTCATTAGEYAPFIWTAEIGMRDLNDYLGELGVDLSGLVLRQAMGISDDGTVIVGTALTTDALGQSRGWMAQLEAPALPASGALGSVLVAALLGLAALGSLGRLRVVRLPLRSTRG